MGVCCELLTVENRSNNYKSMAFIVVDSGM